MIVQLVLDCFRFRHKTRLPEQSPSNWKLLYRCLINNPGYSTNYSTNSYVPTCSLGPDWTPFLKSKERGLTETLQISSPSKLALILTPVPYLGQERHEVLLFYQLEPQATQQGPRNWVKSTHRGSGAVILNVILTEATREFLWATAKSQQHRERSQKEGDMLNLFFFFFSKWWFISSLLRVLLFSSSFRSQTQAFDQFRPVTCFAAEVPFC